MFPMAKHNFREHRQRLVAPIILRDLAATSLGAMMDLTANLKQSRDFEMATYLSSLKAMYTNALLQNSELYDIAFELTGGFASIDEGAILADSRIIRILRYSIAPSISQMKFGQFFELQSTVKFEEVKLIPGSASHDRLKEIAPKLAEFVQDNLDYSRFAWINDASMGTPLAHQYAKRWTCSIAADQNAQTAYRNWRKELQEDSVRAKLISMGYTQSPFTGTVTAKTDIGIGEYIRERKVKGSTTQKADFAFRSKTSQKLVLVEAKAVGVELDATKRIKECCDKAHDWALAPQLDAPTVVAVIAGFFTPTNIQNLTASNVKVIWEHDLDALQETA
jgi:hypothetical protein